MKNRVTSENANAVSLFPFLAVLLCTMGALLVLLVVLAQRAGERAVTTQTAQTPSKPQPEREQSPTFPDTSDEAAKLKQQLAEARAYQQKLSELKEKGEKRLRDEQERLSHLEEHTRSLEHELARLSLAAQQLEATEQDQVVDQQQAEAELARLQQLIKDNEAELEKLREEIQCQRSYAIVPYQGPNGTYRKPVYIECRKEGVVIHPEGIRLEQRDFLDPKWPGNPLAAALRATRTYVNERAAQAGAPEPPDPYPLVLVRPDAIQQYYRVRAAVTSWDENFGYEFIDEDWKLSFPEDPDPILARKQQHAIFLARDQLERLVRSAPSRFRGKGLGGGPGSNGGGPGASGYGYGSGSGSGTGESSPGLALGGSQSSGKATGNSLAGNQSQSGSNAATPGGDAPPGTQPGDTQYGGYQSDSGSAGTGPATGEMTADTTGTGQGQATTTGEAMVGSRYAGSNAAGADTIAGMGGASGGSSGSDSGGATSGAAGGGGSSGNSSSGSPSQGGASGSGMSAGTQSQNSIADSQGRNWAVKAGGRGSVPIRRPIQVVIRRDQLSLLPSRHVTRGESARGYTIQLDQPLNQISAQFVAALRERIKGWGLAGNGLYWRPVLKLSVGPEAQQTAQQVIRLLQDSGVEISPPETARAPEGEGYNATR